MLGLLTTQQQQCSASPCPAAYSLIISQSHSESSVPHARQKTEALASRFLEEGCRGSGPECGLSAGR